MWLFTDSMGQIWLKCLLLVLGRYTKGKECAIAFSRQLKMYVRKLPISFQLAGRLNFYYLTSSLIVKIQAPSILSLSFCSTVNDLLQFFSSNKCTFVGIYIISSIIPKISIFKEISYQNKKSNYC